MLILSDHEETIYCGYVRIYDQIYDFICIKFWWVLTLFGINIDFSLFLMWMKHGQYAHQVEDHLMQISLDTEKHPFGLFKKIDNNFNQSSWQVNRWQSIVITHYAINMSILNLIVSFQHGKLTGINRNRAYHIFFSPSLLVWVALPRWLFATVMMSSAFPGLSIF